RRFGIRHLSKLGRMRVRNVPSIPNTIKKATPGGFMKLLLIRTLATLTVAGLALVAQAQVKIGVTVSATGPAASLGIPEKNTIGMCPKSVAGKTIEYIVLDDASDTTTAVQNTRKLIGESHVDAIIGSTT